MAKKAKLDARTEKPTCLSDIDKYYVVEYTKLNGTPEQRAKIKEVIKKNTVERISQLTKKPYKDVKMKEVRKAFCKEFFKSLVKEKGKITFDDLLDEL